MTKRVGGREGAFCLFIIVYGRVISCHFHPREEGPAMFTTSRVVAYKNSVVPPTSSISLLLPHPCSPFFLLFFIIPHKSPRGIYKNPESKGNDSKRDHVTILWSRRIARQCCHPRPRSNVTLRSHRGGRRANASGINKYFAGPGIMSILSLNGSNLVYSCVGVGGSTFKPISDPLQVIRDAVRIS